MGDDFCGGLRAVVEGGHGREDDAAHFGYAAHVVEVGEVERGFAHHQHEAAAFFEGDVGGTGEQVVGKTVGDGGQRAHGAGGDNHAVHGKRAAGHGRAEVADSVDGVGETVDVVFAVGRFEGAGEFGAFADNQVAFDVGQGAQDFEGGTAVLKAAGAADADDDAAFVHWLSFGVGSRLLFLQTGFRRPLGRVAL